MSTNRNCTVVRVPAAGFTDWQWPRPFHKVVETSAVLAWTYVTLTNATGRVCAPVSSWSCWTTLTDFNFLLTLTSLSYTHPPLAPAVALTEVTTRERCAAVINHLKCSYCPSLLLVDLYHPHSLLHECSESVRLFVFLLLFESHWTEILINKMFCSCFSVGATFLLVLSWCYLLLRQHVRVFLCDFMLWSNAAF